METKSNSDLNGITVYQNKRNNTKKQYNLTLDVSLMNEIDKIQQALQLKLDAYIGKGEILENILKKGLGSSTPAIIVDDVSYSFSDLENIYDWVANDYFYSVIEYLSDFKVLESLINSVISSCELEMTINCEKQKTKEKSTIIDLHNLKDIKIEDLDKEIISIFNDCIYDYFVMNQNGYYKIRNMKYINNIIDMDSSIKISLYFYKQYSIFKNEYKKIKSYAEKSLNKEIDKEKLYNLIVKTYLRYNQMLFTNEFNSENNNMLEKEDSFNFSEDSFTQDNLLKNRGFMICFNHEINKMINSL